MRVEEQALIERFGGRLPLAHATTVRETAAGPAFVADKPEPMPRS
jgi:hypothetical protein